MKKEHGFIKKKLCLMIAMMAFTILLCALAVGCGEQPVATVPVIPTELQVEDDVLTWQEDEKASGYLVSVDGEEYETEGSGFDLFLRLLQPKTYKLQVRALYDGGAVQSDWSEPITYIVRTAPGLTLGTPPSVIQGISFDENGVLRVDPKKAKGKIVIPSVNPQTNKPIRFINSGAFSNCTEVTGIVIPDSVTDIQNNAFYHCTNLKRVQWSARCNTISSGVFTGCAALKKVYFPEKLILIDSYAFKDCSALEEITIPPTVRALGKSVFDGCASLREVVIPKNVVEIGAPLFARCNQLVSVTVEQENTVYRNEGNCIIRRADNVLVAGCPASVIPEGIREIGGGAFKGCVPKDVVIPEGVEIIGTYAFAESEITSLKLPRTLREIGNFAFAKNSSLTLVVIPDGVREIGRYVFYECGSFTAILPGSVETIGGGAFGEGATVYTSAPKDLPAGWYRVSNTDVIDSDWAEGNIIYGCSFGNDDGYAYVTSLTWIRDGDGESAEITASIPAVAEGIPVPYRDGYTFMGWATEASGDTVQYGKTTYEGDEGTYERTLPADELKGLPSGTVLYAVWAPSEAGAGA